jgi:hypothetical protein
MNTATSETFTFTADTIRETAKAVAFEMFNHSDAREYGREESMMWIPKSLILARSGRDVTIPEWKAAQLEREGWQL